MSDVIEETQIKTKIAKPSFYKVIFHNDDFTPMDFVVAILIRFFSKSQEEAEQIMLTVHQNGKGIAGVYSYEIAIQKKNEAIYAARAHEHPLKITVEKE